MGLPTDRPRLPNRHCQELELQVDIPGDLVDRLRALARETGTTLFMVLLAGWSSVLCRWSGEDEIVVGVPVANRSHPRLEKLIGLFVDTLPLRVNVAGSPTVRELLARVKEVALGGYAHQGVPFEMIVEATKPERSLSYAPVFQVMLVLQDAFPQSCVSRVWFWNRCRWLRGLPNMIWCCRSPRVAAGCEARSDTTPGCTRKPRCCASWRAGAWHSERLSTMSAHGFPMFRCARRPKQRRVLAQWSESAPEELDGQSAVQLFDTAALNAPDAAALIDRDRTVSFTELRDSSIRVAGHLLRGGVGPGELVGLLSTRTASLVCATLGILRAGAAYVPLDPGYPSSGFASWWWTAGSNGC